MKSNKMMGITGIVITMMTTKRTEKKIIVPPLICFAMASR